MSIPWYCWLAAAVVLGPIGIALAAVADTVADQIAGNLAEDALQNALGSGIPGISVGGLSGALFSSVAITTEGLTLQGIVPVFVQSAFGVPKLNLNGSVITTNSQVISSGIFHTQLWCMPEAKDYPYTEYAQQQTGSYNLSGTLVSQPFTPHYTLSSGGAEIPLTGTSGTIALPNVNTHYPMPLATGGTALQQTVHIGYVISGTSIQLTNVPAEGAYSFYLNATATDCKGLTVQDNSHHDLSTYIHVQFEGDYVNIGGGYAQDVQHCANLLKQMIQEISEKYKHYQPVPIWQQVNYPPPEGMIEYIRDLVASGLPQTDEILVASKIAHGNSFYRAIFAPAARQPRLLRANARLATNQQQLAHIARQLTDLSQRLLNASSVQNIRVGEIAEKEIKG